MLDREGIIDLVGKIRNGEGNDDDINNWLQTIKESVAYSDVFNIVIRNREGLNIEQIVDRLLNNQSFKL